MKLKWVFNYGEPSYPFSVNKVKKNNKVDKVTKLLFKKLVNKVI